MSIFSQALSPVPFGIIGRFLGSNGSADHRLFSTERSDLVVVPKPDIEDRVEDPTIYLAPRGSDFAYQFEMNRDELRFRRGYPSSGQTTVHRNGMPTALQLNFDEAAAVNLTDVETGETVRATELPRKVPGPGGLAGRVFGRRFNQLIYLNLLEPNYFETPDDYNFHAIINVADKYTLILFSSAALGYHDNDYFKAYLLNKDGRVFPIRIEEFFTINPGTPDARFKVMFPLGRYYNDGLSLDPLPRRPGNILSDVVLLNSAGVLGDTGAIDGYPELVRRLGISLPIGPYLQPVN